MRARTTRPRYITKILELWVEGKIDRSPGLQHIEVRHDDWCPKLDGGACLCKPDVVVRPTRRNCAN